MVMIKRAILFFLLLSFKNNFAETICVIGAGYVGLVTGAGLAWLGHNVCCVDIIAEKIAQLNSGKTPIYEPGLDKLMKKVVDTGYLSFSTNINTFVRQSPAIFIAVGTPMAENGSADLQALEPVFNNIAGDIKEYKVFCIKSTVPVGTCHRMYQLLVDKGISHHLFNIVSNPEFLREGSAVRDFLDPDRIIIGESSPATDIIRKLYQPLIDTGVDCLVTTTMLIIDLCLVRMSRNINHLFNW